MVWYGGTYNSTGKQPLGIFSCFRSRTIVGRSLNPTCRTIAPTSSHPSNASRSLLSVERSSYESPQPTHNTHTLLSYSRSMLPQVAVDSVPRRLLPQQAVSMQQSINLSPTDLGGPRENHRSLCFPFVRKVFGGLTHTL